VREEVDVNLAAAYDINRPCTSHTQVDELGSALMKTRLGRVVFGRE
jgi:hypothetical protein